MKTEFPPGVRSQIIETDAGHDADKTRSGERPSVRFIFDFLVLKAISPVNATLAARWVNDRFWFHPQRLPSHPRESEYLQSAGHFSLECAGRPVATYSWGEGVPVLLVHGWNGRGTQMGAFIEPLVRLGFRVLAFDAPAHGDSPGSHTDFPQIAGIIEQIAAKHGPLHGIIAHSAGCAPSLLALGRTTSAKRVVFISPFAHFDTPLKWLAHKLRLRPRIVSAQRRLLEAIYGQDLYQTYSPVVMVRDLAVLGLVIHDRDDKEVSIEEGRLVAARWPRADFVGTHDLGHYRILRDPAVVQTVTDFLAAGAGARPPRQHSQA
jgi:pimeloyl-ACP methyl ester carboxylesterase